MPVAAKVTRLGTVFTAKAAKNAKPKPSEIFTTDYPDGHGYGIQTLKPQAILQEATEIEPNPI